MADTSQDTTSKIENVNLRTRTAYYFAIISIISGFLLILMIGSATCLSAYVYNEVIKDHGSDTEKHAGLAVPLLSGITVLILILLAIYCYRLHTKIKAEDDFLTDMTRISTAGISSEALRGKFGKYLAAKTGEPKANNPDAIRQLGGYLAGNYDNTSDELARAAQERAYPSFFQRNPLRLYDTRGLD